MFQHFIYHLFVCFVAFIVVCASVDDVKSIAKRSDIDVQTCIENFGIHTDKIIRTQDSRNMGAKYLNEIDLGSREECLRLCCETDTCDVFVYEEKVFDVFVYKINKTKLVCSCFQLLLTLQYLHINLLYC